MTEAGEAATIRSISRAFAIIRCFSPGVDSLSLQEIAARAELPKSTAVRILAALRAEGMIDHDPLTHSYSPGLGFLHWTQIAGHRWGVPASVTELMRSTAHRIGESLTIYVRAGDSRVAIAHIPGNRSLRHVISVGEAMPMSAGASSWILLQEAPPEIVERIERQLRERGAGFTARERITLSLNQGHATSRGEREAGVAGVSIRLELPDGALFGALTVGGPISRITEAETPRLVEQLRQIAPTIGAQVDSRRFGSAQVAVQEK